jgi:hypothetical protein
VTVVEILLSTCCCRALGVEAVDAPLSVPATTLAAKPAERSFELHSSPVLS